MTLREWSPTIHAAHLRQRNVRLVHQQQVIIGEIIEQRPGLLARGAARQVARVVLHAGAIARLLEHFKVVVGALLQPLRLHELVLGLQLGHALFQFVLDVVDCRGQLLLGGDKVLGRVDIHLGALDQHFACQRVELWMRSISSPQNSMRIRDLFISGQTFQRIAAHPETAAHERLIVAGVMDVDQVAQHAVAGAPSGPS